MNTVLLTALATLTLSIVWIYFAQRLGIMDIPNVRSSHSHPIPRGGGIAILTAFSLFFFVSQSVGSDMGLYFVMPALGVGIVGLVDDLRDLPPLTKFTFEFLCAYVVFLGFGLGYVPLGPYKWETGKLLAGFFAILWISGFTNFFNFMDGIDGIAAGEALIASVFLAIHFSRAGDQTLTFVAALVAGCSLGFLAINAPPAKIFMGDAGSLFLGFILSGLVLVGTVKLNIPFWLLALPLYNFIFDPVYTLIKRVVRGEKWYEAHRSHLYQRLIATGRSHRKVTLIEITMAAGLGVLSLLPDATFPVVQVGIVIALGLTSQFVFLVFVIKCERVAKRLSNSSCVQGA